MAESRDRAGGGTVKITGSKMTACKWLLCFPLATIALASALIYSNIFESPFVFDDVLQITNKAGLKDLAGHLSWKSILRNRGIVDLTFAVNYKLDGYNVFGYHLVNVMIHTANGFLVFFLALFIFEHVSKPVRPKMAQEEKNPLILHPALALTAALIFVAHPVQTQAVTYTVQRYASMAAMFYLASVLFYLKARLIQTGREMTSQTREEGIEICTSGWGAGCFRFVAFFFISVAFGIAALLSKQNAASLPAAILVMELIAFHKSWYEWKKKLLWFSLAAVIWAAGVFFIFKHFQSHPGGAGLLEDVLYFTRETEIVGRWSYLCTQFNVLATYIRLLFLPVQQNLDYLYPFKTGFWDGDTPLAFAFLVAIVGVAIANWKKRPVVAMGIGWFFVTLSVESSIFPIRDAVFEHRLYLPTFGFALLLSYLLFHLFSRRRGLAVAASATIVLLLGVTTYVRNEVWRDPVTLWSDVLSKSPQNHRAHCNLGVALLKRKRFQEAIRHLNSALQIKPNYPEAHNNLGMVFAEQGHLDEAIKHYNQALTIRPDYSDARNNLGAALARQGNLDRAIGHFSKVIKRDPNFAEAYNNLGLALAQKGNLEEARKQFYRALQIKPDYVDAHYNLGLLLRKLHKPDQALEHYLAAVRTDPKHAKALYETGLIFAAQGKLDEAIQYFSRAVEARPDFAKAHFNMGIALARKGRYEEALVRFSEALRIQPDYEKARKNLARARKARAAALKTPSAPAKPERDLRPAGKGRGEGEEPAVGKTGDPEATRGELDPLESGVTRDNRGDQ